MMGDTLSLEILVFGPKASTWRCISREERKPPSLNPNQSCLSPRQGFHAVAPLRHRAPSEKCRGGRACKPEPPKWKHRRQIWRGGNTSAEESPLSPSEGEVAGMKQEPGGGPPGAPRTNGATPSGTQACHPEHEVVFALHAYVPGRGLWFSPGLQEGLSPRQCQVPQP